MPAKASLVSLVLFFFNIFVSSLFVILFLKKCINSFVIIIGEGGDEAAFDNEADVTPQMKIKQQLDSRS